MQENSPETMPKIETKNKTFVVVSAILLLSIAVIIAVFFNKNQVNKDVNQEINQEINQETAIQEENEDISDAQLNEQDNNLLFSDLIANRQGSYLCQIEDEEGSYIYYFDNERIAIEIKVEDSHMKTIVDDEFTYNWDVEEKVGTKFANQDDFMEKDLNQESDVFDEADTGRITDFRSHEMKEQLFNQKEKDWLPFGYKKEYLDAMKVQEFWDTEYAKVQAYNAKIKVLRDEDDDNDNTL